MNQTESVAVEVNNVTKIYKIYDNPNERLKEAVHPFKKSIILNLRPSVTCPFP